MQVEASDDEIWVIFKGGQLSGYVVAITSCERFKDRICVDNDMQSKKYVLEEE